MGDEAQKRNTDCVYFLASPLTCKKGADCEYRHSESARVNPRDCWYWLSGNCLNASCSFRHPPLDGRPGASASAPLQVAGGSSAATPASTAITPTTTAAAPSVPSTSNTSYAPPTVSKLTVPCFFFSQGYCAKGGKCPFSHIPTIQYRKEATTYQRPQVSEYPANGEGNGVAHAKQQIQDRKPASQTKASARSALPSQEAGFIPSNVYKLSASGVPAAPGKRLPGVVGEKVDQYSRVGRSKPVDIADDTTRHGQLVESRISQAHFSNECMEQFEKGALKGQLLHLDSGRTTTQGRQSSATYIARISDTLINSETQDLFYELEGQHSARELHVGDLRNHLKRKKNDTAYLSHLKDFPAKELLKDRLETGRLASRAVPVADLKDFVPNNKRTKQDKESSTFSGPKSLAQIKAEKSKVVAENSLEAAECTDDCRIVEPDSAKTREVGEPTSELCLNESRKDSLDDHSGMSVEENKFELKEGTLSVSPEGTKERSIPGAGINNSNGLSSDIVPLRISKEAETVANHAFEMAVSSILKGRDSSRNEENLEGIKHTYHAVDAVEGTRTETGYVSADELMEDGSEAHENDAYDYDEEEDFARKLGRFLS